MRKGDETILVASYIPGRIRFKINLLYNNSKFANYLNKSLKNYKKIHNIEINIEINIRSKSLLLIYDVNELNKNKIYDIINGTTKQYFSSLKVEKEALKYCAITSGNAVKLNSKSKQENKNLKKEKIIYLDNRDTEKIDWYKMSINNISFKLKTNISKGLKEEDIHNLIERYGPNEIHKKKKKSIFSMFLKQFDGYLMKILLGACVLSVFLGQIPDSISIFTIVVVEALLGVWQNYKAEKSLESLEKFTSPLSKVIRDGETKIILSQDLVPGDILCFESGDIISADSRLIYSSNLELNEALLTGESEYAQKSHMIAYTQSVGMVDRKNMVYSGTKVMKGNGKAIVVSTGMNTEIGKIAQVLSEDQTELTPLQKDLNRLGRIITWICMIISLIVIVSGLMAGQPFLEILRTGISLAIGAIPEGLTTILTISLAFGVQRMAKKGALVKELPCVETLSCADVICTDKTGTLTTGTMTVTEIHTASNKYIMNSQGDFTNKYYRVSVMEDTNLMQLITIASLCNNAKYSKNEKNEIEILGDSTEIALKSLSKKFNLQVDHFDCYTRVKEFAFDSDIKKMTVICKDPQGKYSINVKGAIEVVLPMCNKILDNGKTRDITEEDRNLIYNNCDNMAENSLRVLAFAYNEVNSPIQTDEDGLIFVGTVGIIDPPRPEVRRAIRKCHRAGIKVVMITGDHKQTAMAIGKQIDLIQDDSIVLTGNELDKLSDYELLQIIDDVVVFARTSPNQKLRIVKALKEKGHIVCMTGDGINDAPAIKEANIGIAMGKSGTEVTKETASIILTDDNFTTIVNAIEEGRGISGNVKRFLRYVLSGNIGAVLTVLTASLFRFPTPLISSQILMINLVTESVPALALGLDSPNDNVMNEPPRDASKSIFDKKLFVKIISRGVLMGVSAFGLFTGTYLLTGNLIRARTLAYASIVLNQMFHVFDCREKNTNKNKYIWSAIGISFMILLASIYVPSAATLFGTCPLNLVDWGALFFMACYIGRLDYLKELASKLVMRKMKLDYAL